MVNLGIPLSPGQLEIWLCLCHFKIEKRRPASSFLPPHGALQGHWCLSLDNSLHSKTFSGPCISTRFYVKQTRGLENGNVKIKDGSEVCSMAEYGKHVKLARSFLVVDIIIRTTSKKHGPPTYILGLSSNHSNHQNTHTSMQGGSTISMHTIRNAHSEHSPPHPWTPSKMHKVFNTHYPLAGCILNAAHNDCTPHIFNQELNKSHFLVYSAKFTEWVLRV